MAGVDFIQEIKFKIYNTGKVLELGGGGSCMLWTGAKWGTTHYGKIALRLPSNPEKREYFRLHRLVFALNNAIIPEFAIHISADTLTPARQDHQGRSLDVSHICHTAHCINPEHLVLEAHCVNMSRITCKIQKMCMQDHSPHCVFPGKLKYSVKMSLFGVIVICKGGGQPEIFCPLRPGQPCNECWLLCCHVMKIIIVSFSVFSP